MYGPTRFLFESLLTHASQFAVSSQANGIVTNALVNGTGSAELLTGGEFSGQEDLLYTVQISDITGGQDVGQALYRWRESSMQNGVWGGEDILTHTDLQELNQGVMIAFNGGDSPHFSAGTVFTFRVKAIYGAGNLLLSDRGALYRSKTLPSPLTLMYQLDIASAADVCVLLDHNLTDGATVVLKGVNDTDDWGTPDVEVNMSVADVIIAYTGDSTPCLYWRLEVTDTSNPDGYIEIGFWYLGEYAELDANADWGAKHDLEYFMQEDGNDYGVRARQVYSSQEVIALKYSYLSTADVEALRAMAQALYDVASGRVNALILHLFSDESDKVYLADLIGGIPRTYERVGLHNVTLDFEEVVQV